MLLDYGGFADEADYVLTSSIREGKYRGRIYSYGLSVFGPMLWIFGLPAGRSKVDLKLDLILKNQEGSEVWRHTIDNSWKITQGYYYKMGRDMEGLARTLQTGLNDALQNNPPPIK